MIKTIFVPLIIKAYPVGESTQSVQKKLTANMGAALAELDTALDDGWRIFAQQYIDSDADCGTVFFIRDDAECFLEVTDDGFEALDEALDPLIPVNPDDAMTWND